MLTILIVDGECCAMRCNETCLVLRLQGPAWHSNGFRQIPWLYAIASTKHIVAELSPEAYTQQRVGVQHVISSMLGSGPAKPMQLVAHALMSS